VQKIKHILYLVLGNPITRQETARALLFLPRICEPFISSVAVWKQLHLNQWFTKTRHKRSWESSLERERLLLISMNCQMILMTTALIERLATKLKKLNSVAVVRKRTIPSDRRLSAKLVSTFAGRGCCVVSATNSHGR
jgi:hypothetical protein